MLRKLFAVRLKYRSEELDIFNALSADGIIDKSWAQKFRKQQSYTPMSDHLSEILLPLTEKYAPESEFIFDTLEIMIALAYLDSQQSLPDEPRIPLGRFCRKSRDRNSPSARLFSEADREGAEWPPLKAGMFGGNITRLQTIRAALDGSLLRFNRSHW
jgi:hypothetical protein